MYNKNIGYIIEKMRGDCLTPLGTGKSLDEDDFHSNLDVYLEDVAKFKRDFLKLYESGKPFLKGCWDDPTMKSMSRHFYLSFSLKILDSDIARYYMIKIRKNYDFNYITEYNYSVQFFVVGSGPGIGKILVEIPLGEVISKSWNDSKVEVKEKSEAISEQVLKVFGIDVKVAK